MKNYKAILAGFLALALVCGLTVMGCENTAPDNGTGKDDSGGGFDGKMFDLSGATAIYAAEAGSSGQASVRTSAASNSRAITYTDEDVLFKVLEDGSVAPIIVVSESFKVPDVLFIAYPPEKKTKDIYIAFRGDRGENDGSDLGNFLHVREDGTINTLMSVANGESIYNDLNGSVDDFVVFDAAGNLYFRGWIDWRTPVVYKYDPVTSTKTRIFSGNSVDTIKVSSDGSLLFFSGFEPTSIRFLRVIATANPAQSTTLFEFDYSGRIDRYLSSWTLDRDTKTAYLAGASVNLTEPAEDRGEFVKVSVDNDLNCTWTTLVAPEVNWDVFTGLDIRQGISHLTVNADGSVWCISGVGNNWYDTTRLYNELFCWVVDRSGNLMDPTDEPSFIPQVFLDEEKKVAHRIDLAQTRGDWLYYIANTVTDRENSQTPNDQKLYRFNMRNGTAIEDLFVNVSHSEDITINSLDITEKYAYFSGFHGDSYLAGKIDLLNSLAYEPLDFDRKVTAIISY